MYKNEINILKDSFNVWEKQKMQKKLEVQFDVAEKDRLLKIAKQEKEISKLTITLLAASILFLLLFTIAIILFLKRINKRDKQLLDAKELLVKAIEEKNKLQEKQLQNEIEFKESQLSAISLQMLQKNELMQELKEKLNENNSISKDNTIHKIINKGLSQEKDWSDFNSHFESINKNFYTRIKQTFPDISPNEIKICALIKMNLSIKEMAAILNISPDSVKTARYRLRKKMQLNTEDNLTDFILSLH
jgi:DNA-directed RNA polymerase specialized sigma24 family protein